MLARRAPKIDVVPLVDVLMVLIVFFLLTMQFEDLRTLNVNLPKIETAGSNLLKGQLVVSVDAEGSYELNGRATEIGRIRKVMKEIGLTSRDVKVLIASDEDAPLKFITTIIDASRESGLENFRLQSR